MISVARSHNRQNNKNVMQLEISPRHSFSSFFCRSRYILSWKVMACCVESMLVAFLVIAQANTFADAFYHFNVHNTVPQVLWTLFFLEVLSKTWNESVFCKFASPRESGDRITCSMLTLRQSSSFITSARISQVVFRNRFSSSRIMMLVLWQNVRKSLTMTLDSTDPSEKSLFLIPANFPQNCVNGCHPDDGKLVEHPITPERTIHDSDGKLRLYLRISFRVLHDEKIRYFPLSFIIDTGAIIPPP